MTPEEERRFAQLIELSINDVELRMVALGDSFKELVKMVEVIDEKLVIAFIQAFDDIDIKKVTSKGEFNLRLIEAESNKPDNSLIEPLWMRQQRNKKPTRR